jgi:hypothetical protein
MHGDVRFDERQVEKEGPRLVGFEELDGLGDHQPRRIRFADPVLQPHLALRLPLVAGDGIGVDRNPLGVAPQVRRIKTVGHRLTVVTEEQIESFAVGIARAAHRPQAPLAHRAGGVTGPLKYLSQREGLFRQRILAFREFRKRNSSRQIPAHLGVPRMPAGHQHAACRSTHRRARIMPGESRSLRSQPIEVGRGDLLLAVTTQFAPAQIVSQNEDDVRPLGRESFAAEAAK